MLLLRVPLKCSVSLSHIYCHIQFSDSQMAIIRRLVPQFDSQNMGTLHTGIISFICGKRVNASPQICVVILNVGEPA